jgi:hypothetical protein
MEGGDLRGSVVLLLYFNGKINVCYSCVSFPSFDFYFEVDPRPAASSLPFQSVAASSLRPVRFWPSASDFRLCLGFVEVRPEFFLAGLIFCFL